jgi:hypothetical protein
MTFGMAALLPYSFRLRDMSKYTRMRLIGPGKFGAVSLCRHPETGAQTETKRTLSPQRPYNHPDFVRELEFLIVCARPSVVGLHGFAFPNVILLDYPVQGKLKRDLQGVQ